jgi:hypothetical protein
MSQLSTDCLNDIFEYFKDDIATLHSCLLVNRLWCIVSVKIFWRDTRNYCKSNFKTLIACLPNESKEILRKNGIKIYNNNLFGKLLSALYVNQIILIPTSKSPMFNYESFCKVLSINRVHYMIKKLLDQWKRTHLDIVVQEICKMFMNQSSTLKGLIMFKERYIPYSPEIKDCLKNLSELHCNSIISSDIFYQLSHLCHNISLLDIVIEQNTLNNGLIDLIKIQKNLKYFIISQYGFTEGLFPLLITKLPNTLNKLNIREYNRI